ncbi:MAG: hypothetical protein M1829_002706 [Trizodia sp. TS-e1964]|nr:MAG: hypothetical protein M1829_002706 [Trizodia sp. TS-e1964]
MDDDLLMRIVLLFRGLVSERVQKADSPYVAEERPKRHIRSSQYLCPSSQLSQHPLILPTHEMHALAPLALLALFRPSAASPTPTFDARPTSAWPTPTPASNSVAYRTADYVWPVIPQEWSNQMTVGAVAEFIANQGMGNRAKSVPVVYLVVRESPTAADGVVVHTLGLLVKNYASVPYGWLSEDEGKYYEALELGGERKLVAWGKMAIGLTFEDVDKAIRGVGSPGVWSASLTPTELQDLRLAWVQKAANAFYSDESIKSWIRRCF